MDLEELRAFLNVVKTGSFLAAADSLGVSRTTLRRRVEALEARVGVPLLKSTRQGVVVTEAGRVLAQRGQLMVQEASALLSSLREVGQEPSGVLRVVMPVGLPPHLLTPLFAHLRATWPRLHVHARFSHHPLGEPLDNVDMAVHFNEYTPKGPWRSYTLLRLQEGLIASKEYLQRRGVPRSVAELHGHELFAWQAPGEPAHTWPTLRGTTFTVEPALVATDIHLIRSCCIAGLGIGLVPSMALADPSTPEDLLVPILPEEVGRERPVCISVPEALSEIPKIKQVLSHVQRMLDGL